MLGNINQIEQKGGGLLIDKKCLPQISMPICTYCPLGPEVFEIPNNMVHVLNPNYRYKVNFAEKIHPQRERLKTA